MYPPWTSHLLVVKNTMAQIFLSEFPQLHGYEEGHPGSFGSYSTYWTAEPCNSPCPHMDVVRQNASIQAYFLVFV